jgi:transcriptional regulator with XRE-family HTH domain
VRYAAVVSDSLFGPVEIPASAWQQKDLCQALQGRDVGEILRLAQRYGGVSQVRLANATGIAQGRVNEIVNGRRQVIALEVFERIAAGLAMPDEARILAGLAPANAAARAAFAGHAEIAQVFARQADAEAELRALTRSADVLDLLAVRALGLIGLNDSLLRGPLAERTDDIRVRVLLLDPDAPAASARASEIGERPEGFAAGIRLSITRLAELADCLSVSLQVALYQDLPTWRIIRLDSTLFLSAFGRWSEGHRSGMYKLSAAVNGVLHAGFVRHFEDVWQRSRLVLGSGQ